MMTFKEAEDNDLKSTFKDVIKGYDKSPDNDEDNMSFSDALDTVEEPDEKEISSQEVDIDTAKSIESQKFNAKKTDKDIPKVDPSSISSQPDINTLSIASGMPPLPPQVDDNGNPIEIKIPENPEDVDLTLNSFADKMSVVSTLFKERGYIDIKSLIKDGYGNISVDTKIDKETMDQIKVIANDLKMDIDIEEQESPSGKIYNVKFKNRMTVDDFRSVYKILKRKNKEKMISSFNK